MGVTGEALVGVEAPPETRGVRGVGRRPRRDLRAGGDVTALVAGRLEFGDPERSLVEERDLGQAHSGQVTAGPGRAAARTRIAHATRRGGERARWIRPTRGSW